MCFRCLLCASDLPVVQFAVLVVVVSEEDFLESALKENFERVEGAVDNGTATEELRAGVPFEKRRCGLNILFCSSITGQNHVTMTGRKSEAVADSAVQVGANYCYAVFVVGVVGGDVVVLVVFCCCYW